MGSPSKYSKEWYGNKGRQDRLKGESNPPHSGVLDNLFGTSRESREKRDSYKKGNKKRERDR